MDQEHLADDLVQRRVDAVLERVWKLRASHHAARCQLARRARSVGRAPAPATLEQVLARREADDRKTARAVKSLTQRRVPDRNLHPLDQVQPPSLPDAAPVPASGTPPPRPGFQQGLGLSGLKAYEWDDERPLIDDPEARTNRFGAGLYELRDAAALGVAEVRQFGPRDLRWELLTAWDEDRRRVPIPFDPVDIRTTVLEGPRPEMATNVARFADLLAGAWRARVKLRFTFLTLGGGTDATVENGDREPDATEYKLILEGGLTPEVIACNRVPLGVPQQRVLRQYWSPDYLDDAGLTPGSAEANYYLCSLDLTDSIKRQRIRELARACAALLLEAEKAVKAGAAVSPAMLPLAEGDREAFSLDQVLDGIELFNETEIRNLIIEDPGGTGIPEAYLPEESGEMWGRAWIWAALGFVEEFRAVRGTDAAVPTLFLPGLSSVSGPDIDDAVFSDLESVGSWTYKQAFLLSFLHHVTRTWSVLRGEPAFIRVPLFDLPPLDEVVGGIDYHWYHFRNSGGDESLPPLHCGWLMTEVGALVGLLEANGLDGRVSVFESSTSGISGGADAYQVTRDMLPNMGIGDAEAEEFQAGDIWRRMLAAKAGGAFQAGWHPWMEASPAYLGCGVRYVPVDVALPASEATARLSWFAFHRLAALVRDAGEVALVRPATLPARADLVLSVGASSAAAFPSVLVFELRDLLLDSLGGMDLRTHSRAYVVLVDPLSSSMDRVAVAVTAPAGEAPELVSLEPFADEPDAWANPIPPAIAADPELVVAWLLTYRAWDSIPLPTPVPLAAGGTTAIEVQRGGRPQVLLSRVPLSWPE